MAEDWISVTLYPNGTMKNKLGIRDAAKLADLEFQISAERELLLLKEKVKVGQIEDLKKIHKIMFSPLYEWAGHYRKGDFRKGNTVFFPRERFDYAEEDINEAISNLPKKGPLTAENYASLIDKINFFHPFREGNGRSTRTFLQLLALEHGQAIDYPLTNEAMIVAENEADIAKIALLIRVKALAE